MTDETTDTGGAVGPAPAYGDWGSYEPDAIKRRVPLQWAIGKFFGVWDAGGDMMSCPFPDHGDDTPSFNLWSADADGLPQRYGCFGCGQQGDVISLIQFVRGVGFTDACRIAVEELAPEVESTDWVPTETITARHTASPEQLERTLAAFGPMTAASFSGLIQFMRRKGVGGEPIERYAVEQWGWGGVVELGPTVYMPHRDRAGLLTGIKYRAARSDSRWNEDGSHFPALYGAWRDQGRANVFLAEGETDTLRAAYDLRDEPFEVFGLPSGANQRPTGAMAEQLKGRTVYICGDGDSAGFTANRVWYESGIATYVVRMPEGEDIISCGIPVTELLDRKNGRVAQPRTLTTQVTVDDKKFLKDQGVDPKTHEAKPMKPLGDFAFWPDRELITDDGPAWEGTITGKAGQPVLLRTQDLNDKRSFVRWAGSHGARSFIGSDTDVQFIRNWVAAHADYLPLEKATTKAGKVGRSFVGPGDLCIGPDRLRYIAPVTGDAKLATKIAIQPGPYDPAALVALETLNDPTTMAAILGWLAASLIRGERAPAPPLFIAGESGAGKTHLIETVLDAFGFSIGGTLTTTTPYGVDTFVNSTIGFPVWFDEFRSGAREDSIGRLRQILRDAYNGQPSVKGGMTQNRTELSEVSTWAGIIVSGEMGTSETSLRDRLVYIQLDPDARRRDPYQWLRSDPRRTEGLGHALLTFLAARPDSLFRVREVGPESIPDRYRQTLGFVATGWDAWLGFRASLGLEDAPVGPNFAALAHAREVTADPYLELLRHCEGKPTKRGEGYIVEAIGDEVRIFAAEAIAEAREAGIEVPGRANELISWLKRRYDTRTGVRIGARRCTVVRGLDLDKDAP